MERLSKAPKFQINRLIGVLLVLVLLGSLAFLAFWKMKFTSNDASLLQKDHSTSNNFNAMREILLNDEDYLREYDYEFKTQYVDCFVDVFSTKADHQNFESYLEYLGKPPDHSGGVVSDWDAPSQNGEVAKNAAYDKCEYLYIEQEKVNFDPRSRVSGADGVIFRDSSGSFPTDFSSLSVYQFNKIEKDARWGHYSHYVDGTLSRSADGTMIGVSVLDPDRIVFQARNPSGDCYYLEVGYGRRVPWLDAEDHMPNRNGFEKIYPYSNCPPEPDEWIDGPYYSESGGHAIPD